MEGEWESVWVRVWQPTKVNAPERDRLPWQWSVQPSGVWQCSADLVYFFDPNCIALALLKGLFCCGSNRAWHVCLDQWSGTATEEFIYTWTRHHSLAIFFFNLWGKLQELLYLFKTLQVGTPAFTVKYLIFFYLTLDVLSLQKTWGKQPPLLVIGGLFSSVTWLKLYSPRNIQDHFWCLYEEQRTHSHGNSENIVWLIFFYDLTTAWFVDVESA